jgi:cytochrome c oxidase cbb3-type subunit 2
MHAADLARFLAFLALAAAACSQDGFEEGREPVWQQAPSVGELRLQPDPQAGPEPHVGVQPDMSSFQPGMTDHRQAMQQLMMWMSGAELTVEPSGPKPVEDAPLREAGGRLFASRCVACHGEKGDGEGPDAHRLTVPPRDFTTGVFKLRSTPTGSLPLDEDLFRTISRGMHGTAMLPFVTLTEAERWALVAHVKTLSPRFASTAPAEPLDVPAAPAVTPALVATGRELYASTKCNACHGEEGRGDGLSAASLTDASGRPIHLRDLGEGRFKRSTSVEDVYLTLRTGLDGSPMPSFEPALSHDQTWALAAYIHELSQRDRQTARARPRGLGMMGPGMMGPMMGRGTMGMGRGMMGHDPEEHLGMMINMPAMMMHPADSGSPAPRR